MTSEEIKNSILIQEYIDAQIQSYKLQYPQAKESDLRTIITRIVEKRLKDIPAVIHNDYQDDRVISTSLLGVYNWYKTSGPIAAGNGTFFFNQDKAQSPISDIIASRIQKRKEARNQRDEFVKTPNCYEYKFFEMIQMEIKVTINAIYGSFGTPTFQLYNLYTAGSTTGTAQSLISTTAMSFESFMKDNVKFKSLDECMTFIKNTISEKHNLPLNNITIHDDPDEIFERLKKVFVSFNPRYTPILKRTIENLDSEERTRIFYKNNIMEFTKNKMIQDMIVEVFNQNKEFRDANKPPEEIRGMLDDLWSYYGEFVFYNHPYVERIKRLRQDERKEVILTDTDSNVINIMQWTEYLEQNIYHQTKTTLEAEDMKFLSVNILAYMITQMLSELLAYYCKTCNVLDRMAGKINMKNELYFPKILLSKVKKRYIAQIRLREGKVINPPKPEIKGHDFKKAGTSEKTEAALKDIIQNCILVPEVNPVDVSKMNSKLFQFENEIRESLKNGERNFLTRMNCKQPIAYNEKTRMSQGAVLGVLLWDTLNPENVITLPDKLDMVHINIPNLETLEPIREKFPKIYERMDKYIFNGPVPELAKGLKYLALPNSTDPIPEWVVPFIDINKIVSKNIGTFKPVTEALTFHTLKASSETEFFSNIIDI